MGGGALLRRYPSSGLPPGTDEAMAEGFDIYDVEYGMLNGKIRKTWPREGKYEVIGSALDGRPIGIVCRITRGRKVRVITVYEDRPQG